MKPGKMKQMGRQRKKLGKARRIIQFFLVVLGAGIACVLLINLYVIRVTNGFIIPIQETKGVQAECALVLGARVYQSGDLSPMLEDRVATGIALYQDGFVPKLLMSGDHGQKNYDEVNAMKRYALSQGVPEEAVFMDHAGFSTYESMYRAHEVFLVKKVIIVTQKFHLNRALYIARAMGMEAYGVIADQREYENEEYNQFRESLARVKDFFTVLIRPRPTYLGEAVPIGGSGTVTQD